ncbi:MAG: transglutaminase domain-containing protein [Bacteroidota bacterium]
MKVTAFTFILTFMYGLSSYAQVSDFDHISFRKADSVALSYKGMSLEDMPKLSGKLVGNLNTDVEKFRAIFMWTCTNIANDYDLFQKHKRKRERFIDDSLKLAKWNEELNVILFENLLERQKTICTGYAYVIKQLSKFAGIRCRIIDGFARASTLSVDELMIPNHSWNAIFLDGKWYLCDATWASGVAHPKSGRFKFEFNDGFFLTEPELFIKNHYPVDVKWTLLSDNIPSLEDFMEGPLIYNKAYKIIARHDAPERMHNTVITNQKITFKYQLQENIDIEEVTLLIDNGIESNSVKRTPKKDADNMMTVDYQFKKTGFYDVHLLINDDYISTCTYQVSAR